MACNVFQMRNFELTQDHTKARIKKLRTLVMLVCPTLYDFLGNILVRMYALYSKYNFIQRINLNMDFPKIPSLHLYG